MIDRFAVEKELNRRLSRYLGMCAHPKIEERDADLIRGQIQECRSLLKHFGLKDATKTSE